MPNPKFSLSLGLGAPTLNGNKSIKIINGNQDARQRVLNMGHWICRMGLLGAEGDATDKLEEVANFIHQHNLYVLGVSEAALHGQN